MLCNSILKVKARIDKDSIVFLCSNGADKEKGSLNNENHVAEIWGKVDQQNTSLGCSRNLLQQ